MTFNVTTNNAVIHKNRKMKRRRRTCGNVCLLILGIILVSVGLSIFFYFEAIYDFVINQALSFNPNSEPYRVWQKNDPALDMDIYLFNWTNPEDLRTPGVKPKFEEIGPYRFKEVREKINVTWHNHNNTISYKHKKSYYFDAENSVRNLSDVVTIINPVPLSIAYKVRDWSYFSKLPISSILSRTSSLYVTKTAGEILFDGYEETILSALSILPLDGVLDKFGLFYGRNATIGDDGIFSMWTENDEDFGKVMSWNYKNNSGYYDDHCGDVIGSAGEFYPLNQKRDYIKLFSAELCKYAVLEYEKDVVLKGVKGYKYSAKNLFDNGTLRPENKCFCSDECTPSGLLNVSKCRKGSPSFLSLPHFYGADPYYLNSVDGLHPQDKHEFFITLEPKSGITIDIAAMMQLNMLLQPIDYIEMYENVPRIFMPIFYFAQTIPLTDELASNLSIIQSLPDICNIAVLILVSLGLLSVVWMGLNIYCCSKDKFEREEHKIPRNAFEEIPLRS